MARAFISLRLKLTFWYLVLFVVIQVTLVLVTVLLRRDMILRAFDGQLRQRADSFVERLVAASPPWTTENLRSLAAVEPGIALCAVRNRSGEIVAASINRDLRGLPSLDDPELSGIATGAVFTTLPATAGRLLTGTDQPLRLVTMPFKDRQGVACVLQAATRAEVLDQLRGPLLDLFVLGVPIGLVAAMIPAWRIARRATAPIHQISAAARQVSPDQSTWGIQLEARDPEVVKLQAELNEALERLEIGFRAQEQFVSNVSHELRTPITVLLTESQVLKAGNPTQAECLQYLGSVEDEMRRLGRLVESVLDLVRAGLGRTCVRREPVSVNDVVLRAVRHSAPQARRRKVRLVPQLAETEPEEHEPGLVGDPDLLGTMLENLVRNAIRFSPPGQSVLVSARFHRAHVQLVVRDRGPGIPDEYLDKVFDRYVQAPGDTGNRQGTGLGLAIAREVAVLHGGSISAWNRGHGGCAFGVRLPLRKPAAG